MILKIQVRGQVMKPLIKNVLANHSQEFSRFVFFLSDDWDGLTTFAQFRQGDAAYNVYLDSENACYLPPEIAAGKVSLMLYGTGEDVVGTTNAITMCVSDNKYVSDAQSTEITESLYQQLVNEVRAVIPSGGTVGQVLTRAANGKTAWSDAGTPTQEQITAATDAWLEENVAQETGYVLDSTLTMRNAAAPADKVGDLKNAVTDLETDLYPVKNDLPIFTTASSWRLSGDGLCQTNSDYKMIKYTVTAGSFVKIVSDDKFQFQSAASVPDSGTNSNLIGSVYGAGTYFLSVPSGATYLILSTGKTSTTYGAYLVANRADDIGSLTGQELVWDAGTTRDLPNVLVQSSYSNWSSLLVQVSAGDVFYVKGSGGGNSRLWVFADSEGAPVETSESGLKVYDYIKIIAPEGASYLACNVRTNDEYSPSCIKGNSVKIFTDYYSAALDTIIPELTWRNGSLQNTGNVNYIATTDKYPTNGAVYATLIFEDSPIEGYNYRALVYSETTTGTHIKYDTIFDAVGHVLFIPLNNNEAKIKIAVAQFDGENYSPMRIATTDTSKIHLLFQYSPNNRIDTTALKNARYIKSTTTAGGEIGTTLTLMHLSDIHGDSATLARISEDLLLYGAYIDDAICTGDLVNSTYGRIESWWNPKIMTCIGNHDSAEKTDGVFNWTALSMADRDAYYIAPFESNWDVVHTSGTSYYYKDYTSQNVRLIVVDGMLYMGTQGTEATTQTTWITDLLDDAIENNLHVLIAIHAPHGGGAIKTCSFSQLGVSTFPTYSDCNTPQTLIDIVDTKITGGLNFIGYLVGHEHKDYIVDAENDGKQLMYCVTCASSAQWKKSDQYRYDSLDAYNIVCIDTTNTLIKIIRGGGADITNDMRTRKAICFNYSTGAIVGELT